MRDVFETAKRIYAAGERLADAYTLLGVALEKHGCRNAYDVTLSIWQHRHEDGEPDIGFTFTVMHPDAPGGCYQAYRKETIEEAIDAILSEMEKK